MTHYTLEEFKREIEGWDLGHLLGALNVSRFEKDRVTKLKKTRTLTEMEWSCLQSSMDRIPILEAEMARRNEPIPRWLYPASMFNDKWP